MNDDLRRQAAAHVFVDDLDDLVLAPDDEHHLARALRLRAGELVTVSDGRGRWRATRWSGGGIEAAGEVVVEPADEPRLTVGFVPAKGDRPQRVVRALTELGIDRIVPLTSARAVVRWEGDRAARHHERLARVVREAAMQSRRVWLPTVAAVTALVEVAGPGVARADPAGSPLARATAAVLVGPEGGWAPEELDGLPLVSLGPTILRAETAAIAAGVLLADLRDRQRRGGRDQYHPAEPGS